MRAVFLFLLLANLGFFAWANFFSDSDAQSDASSSEPDRSRLSFVRLSL